MADLSEVLSSQSVKIAGANPSSGVEDNYLEVDTSGRIIAKMNDGSGNSLASSTTTPAGTEQALIVRNIPSGTQTVSGTVAATQSGNWSVRLQDGAGTALTSTLVSTKQALDVNVVSSLSITSGTADKATFTYGTTLNQTIGGVFQDTSPTLTAGQSGALRLTANRAAHANLRDASGTELGTSGSPLRVDPTGTTTQPISATSLPLPTGASTSALQTTGNSSLSSIDTKTPALGQALAAASTPVVLTAAQLTTLTPLSTIAATQSGSWTVTANAGTNLNTSALALDTTAAKLTLAQASTTSGQTGPLVQGAVTTASPSYTTAQTSPLSLTTAGALRVDASATTQPISGTVAATQSGTWNINNISGTVSLPTGAATSALQTTGNTSLSTIATAVSLAQGSTTSGQSGALTLAAVTTAAPSYTTAQTSPLSLTTAGALRTDSSATTQPISASSLPLPTGAATSAKQPALGTAGTASTDVLTVQGIASMVALKVDGSAVTQPVSGTLSIGAGSGTVTHTSGTAGSTSSQALASNSSRKYLMIQNHSTRVMWFALGTAATAAKPSIRLLSNTTFTMESSFVSTQAVNAIREGSNDVDFTIVEG